MNSRKWLCITSLAAAGVLSLGFSLFGLMFFLWGGFPPKENTAAALALGLPYLLSFPLVLLAVLVWKPASRILWLAVPFPWLGVIGFSYRDLDPRPLKFLASVAVCAYPILPLVILAALVQYGIRFFEVTGGSNGYKWSGVLNDHAD
jgi:hypothetical protein